MNRWPSVVLAVALSAMPAWGQKESENDGRIHDQVLMKLAADPEVKGGGFDVEVHDGNVVLKGKVEKEQQRRKAERLVKRIKGVSSVSNQLVVSPK